MITFKVYNIWTEYCFSDLELKEKYPIMNLINNIGSHEYSEFVKTFGGLKHSSKVISLNKKDMFPTGLIVDIMLQLNESFPNLEVSIIDKRVHPINVDSYPCKLSHDLDLNQQLAVNNGIENERGYFKMPTGAGKTNVMIFLLAHLGSSSLILEPTTDLVEQISKDINKSLQLTVTNIIGRSSLYENIHSIVVASIDTLDANFELLKESGWFKQFQNLFIDEIHHANFTKRKIVKKGKQIIRSIPAGFTAYYKVAMEVDSFYRFGFTATPKSEIFIKAITGEKLIDVSEDSLIESGRLSTPYIFMIYHTAPFFDEVKDSLNFLYKSESRNRLIVEAVQYLESKGKTVLVMIDSVMHQIKLLKEMLPNHTFITGGDKAKARKELYAKLESGEITSIIMTVGKEGLNIPSVDCIIRGSGKKSETLITQEKGRGMRKTKDKDKVLIIDFIDDDGSKKTYKQGVGYRTKKGHLIKHSEQRFELYNSTKAAKIFKIKDTDELYLYIQKFIENKL